MLAPIQIRLGRYRKAISWSVIGGGVVVALGWGGRLVMAERQAFLDRDAALSLRIDASEARVAQCEVQVQAERAAQAATLAAIQAQLTQIQSEGRSQAQRLDTRIAEIQVILMNRRNP